MTPEPPSQAEHLEDDLPLDVVIRTPATRRTHAPRMRALWVLPIAIIFMLAVATVSLYFQPPGVRLVMKILGLKPGGGTDDPIAIPAPQPETAADTIDDEIAARRVMGLGVVLPTSEVITLSPPYGAGDARVATIEVGVGSRVIAGAVIAHLDNEGPLKRAVETAQADSAVKSATVEQIIRKVEASRAEAFANLKRARATADIARIELKRAESLSKQGAESTQNLDRRRSETEQASRDVELKRATLSRYEGDVSSHVDVVLAKRNLDAAHAALNAATHELERAYVRTPIDGTVLDLPVRVGERPGSEGVARLGDLEHMKAEVEIYQSHIGRVKIGDEVSLHADALPRPLLGHVSTIGLEIGSQTMIADDPAANRDARVVTVTVGLEKASSATAAQFTQLQVVAEILVGDRP